MKCEIIINRTEEEKVIIYAKEETEHIKEIKKLAESDHINLTGYSGDEIVKLSPKDIYIVTIIDNKVYAITKEKSYALKERLYVLEKALGDDFVKINQSSLANTKKIESFDASISGTLKIRFKNGYTDYVSRRQLKFVKERLGL